MGEDDHTYWSCQQPLAYEVYSNMGVLQTTVAEIVTVKDHQRKWYPNC